MSKILETTKEIKLSNDLVLIISKKPIGKIIKLLKEIQKLPPELSKIGNNPTDDVVEQLPMILATSMDSAADIIVKAVDQPNFTKEVLEAELGLEDVLLIVQTFLEVNNVSGILEQIKKVQATVKPAPVNQPQPESQTKTGE